MKNFKDCIMENAKATNKQSVIIKASQIVKNYEEARDASMRRGLSVAQAEISASDHVLDMQLQKSRALKKKVLIQSTKNIELNRYIKSFADGKDPLGALQSLFDYSAGGDASKNYTIASKVALSQISRLMAKALEEMAVTKTERLVALAGANPEKALGDDIVREMLGENTGNKNAKELATAVAKALEYSRVRLNDLGADIGKIEGGYVPQRKAHDVFLIDKIGMEKWSEKISTMLNWDKMTHKLTGLPILENEKKQYLKNVYETISSRGMNKIDPLELMKDADLSKSFEHDRSLHFKDADSLIAYHKEFGQGSVFDGIISHITSAAHHIGLMEVLGASPAQGFNVAKITAEKLANELRLNVADPSKKTYSPEQIKAKINVADVMFESITGQLSPIQGKLLSTGNTLSNLFYGSAMAMTSVKAPFYDGASMKFYAEQNGLKGVGKAWANGLFKTFVQIFPELTPEKLGLQKYGNKAFKQRMAEEGLAFASAFQSIARVRKTYATIYGEQFTARLSDAAIRFSLLNATTEIQNAKFQELIMMNMANMVSKKQVELNPKNQKLLAKYKITEKEWEEISTTPLVSINKKVKMLRVQDVANRSPALGKKYYQLIHGESAFAVYKEAHKKARATLTGRTRKGTLDGELIRSFSTVKGYSLSVYFNHMNRGLAEAGLKNKAQYIGKFIAYGMVAAMVADQMADLAKGKKPRSPQNMDEGELISYGFEMFMKAGGVGFLGDFIYAAQNQYGQGIDSFLAGANASTISDAGQILFQIPDLIKGEDTNIAGDTAQLASKFIPKPAPIALVMERMIVQELLKMADPNAEDKFNRQIDFLEKEKNQEYYWNPGEGLPN